MVDIFNINIVLGCSVQSPDNEILVCWKSLG